MQRFPVAATAAAVFLISACSSGSSGTEPTLPNITLLTTTTTTTVPIFDPVDEPEESVEETAAETTTTAETTTLPPTTLAPTTTVVDDDAETPFDLELNGIGAAAFGADPDGIIGFISSFIGGPTSDTGYIDPFEFGSCAGTQARRVFWGSLMLEFGDSSDVADGRLHFYAYQYGTEDPAGLAEGTPPRLATPDGITYGSTVGELIEAYPDVEFLEADEFLPATFLVNDNLRGFLTGLTNLDSVIVITGGLPCEG